MVPALDRPPPGETPSDETPARPTSQGPERATGESTDGSTVGSASVTVHYWASVRAAAGVAHDRLEVSGPVSLASVLEEIRTRHADRPAFGRTLAVCSVLVVDRPVGGHDPAAVVVQPGDRVELLPPFAGG